MYNVGQAMTETLTAQQDAWKECKQVFGKQNVLVVSNSAGTHLDGGGIQVGTLTERNI